MRTVLFALSLIVVVFLVVSCAPGSQEPTAEEKAQLEQLSDEELLEITAAEDQAAVAGQAVKITKGFRAGAKGVLETRMLSKAQFFSMLQNLPQDTNLKVIPGTDGKPALINPGTGESYSIPTGGGAVQPPRTLTKDGNTIACENNQPVVRGAGGGSGAGGVPTSGRPSGRPTNTQGSCPPDCYEDCGEECIGPPDDPCSQTRQGCWCVACGGH